MRAKSTNPSSPGRARKGAAAIRWSELPHDDLWRRAEHVMRYGSRERSQVDALWHNLKRVLPREDAGDHLKYVDLECARIVDQLRAVRDVYRDHLTEKGCKPSRGLHWAIFRFGVMRQAAPFLQFVMTDYLGRSRIPMDSWRLLYVSNARIDIEPAGFVETINDLGEISETISSHLTDAAFRQWVVGGPFGRDSQRLLAKSRPWYSVQVGLETEANMLQQRLRIWDGSRPWTEGLSRLFDATQEEIIYQHALLSEERRFSETLDFKLLPPLESICHKHLIQLRDGSVNSRNLSSDQWLKLLGDLDRGGLSPDKELGGKAREVLTAVRRKGHKVSTWVQCYESKARVSLEDGKSYALRREVTHALHNAAKRAKYCFDKDRST
jgi:hypothetical protein